MQRTTGAEEKDCIPEFADGVCKRLHPRICGRNVQGRRAGKKRLHPEFVGAPNKRTKKNCIKKKTESFKKKRHLTASAPRPPRKIACPNLRTRGDGREKKDCIQNLCGPQTKELKKMHLKKTKSLNNKKSHLTASAPRPPRKIASPARRAIGIATPVAPRRGAP